MGEKLREEDIKLLQLLQRMRVQMEHFARDLDVLNDTLASMERLLESAKKPIVNIKNFR